MDVGSEQYLHLKQKICWKADLGGPSGHDLRCVDLAVVLLESLEQLLPGLLNETKQETIPRNPVVQGNK